MNPQETRAAEELIFAIRDKGIAVLVIEHDMRFIFNLCDRVACLVQGEKLVEGTAAEVKATNASSPPTSANPSRRPGRSRSRRGRSRRSRRSRRIGHHRGHPATPAATDGDSTSKETDR